MICPGDVDATTITSATITTTGDITCTSPGEFVGTLNGAASSAALADAVVVAQATDDVGLHAHLCTGWQQTCQGEFKPGI